MTAYYNEFDPYAAQWLRNLIAAGHIAPGVVDERSIQDVTAGDLAGFTQCHFFAGIGVWSLALRRAGWPDDRPVWTMSCPCQPFSAAGAGAGFDDERHLWPDAFHLITQCAPAIVFGEQVASKPVEPWVDLVHADLEALGYAFGRVPFPSAGVGAPHIRDRLFWVADLHSHGCDKGRECFTETWRDGVERDSPTNGMVDAESLRREGQSLRAGSRLPPGGASQTGGISSVAHAGLSVSKQLARKGSGSREEGERRAHSRWLMGLPQEWDDCAPTETLSTLKQRRNSSSLTWSSPK